MTCRVDRHLDFQQLRFREPCGGLRSVPSYTSILALRGVLFIERHRQGPVFVCLFVLFQMWCVVTRHLGDPTTTPPTQGVTRGLYGSRSRRKKVGRVSQDGSATKTFTFKQCVIC